MTSHRENWSTACRRVRQNVTRKMDSLESESVEYDYVAWLIFAAAALLVGLVAAVEVALTAVDRAQIRKRSEDGDSRAVLVEGLLQDSSQFWLTSMLVKTVGLLSAGVAVGRVFTASAGIVTVVFATILAWLALGAVADYRPFAGRRQRRTGGAAPGAIGTNTGRLPVALHLYALPGR